MYQSRINGNTMGFGIAFLVMALGFSVASFTENSVFALIAALVFFGTISMVLVVIYRDKGGIPVQKPKDYIDESFVFCPIKERGGFWLATAHDFKCATVAVSQLDFAPKDRESICASLEKSIQEEKRLKITAYSCWVGKGYIFVLVDPKDQKKNSQNGA